MTEKRVIECDGGWCEPTETLEYKTVDSEPEWVEYDYDGHTRHYCPTCAWRALQWAVNQRSIGKQFQVKHSYIGETFEEAAVMPSKHIKDSGTQSMTISKLIDEPPRDYPDYDHEEDEAWHFHVHDHLGLTIQGKHKDRPTVTLLPEEFGTTFVVRESGSGHSFDTVYVEEGVTVKRCHVEEDEGVKVGGE